MTVLTLETPVPLFQHPGEFSRLLDLYRLREPRRVLEVGTYHGGSLYHWLQNAADDAVVVSIDSYKTGIDNRELYPLWCRPGVTVIAIEGDSNAVETAWQADQHGPYDWIWIDAGHRYHEVNKDWQLYRHMAALAAVVCFHDILPPSRQWPDIEVSRLWEQLKRDHVTDEFVDNPRAAFGGIGVIYL